MNDKWEKSRVPLVFQVVAILAVGCWYWAVSGVRRVLAVLGLAKTPDDADES